MKVYANCKDCKTPVTLRTLPYRRSPVLCGKCVTAAAIQISKLLATK